VISGGEALDAKRWVVAMWLSGEDFELRCLSAMALKIAVDDVCRDVFEYLVYISQRVGLEVEELLHAVAELLPYLRLLNVERPIARALGLGLVLGAPGVEVTYCSLCGSEFFGKRPEEHLIEKHLDVVDATLTAALAKKVLVLSGEKRFCTSAQVSAGSPGT